MRRAGLTTEDLAGLVEVLVHVPTVEHALGASIAMYRVFTRRPAWDVQLHGATATFRLTEPNPTPLYVHMMLHTPLKVLEWLARGRIPVLSATVDHRLAPFAAESGVILGCEPQLGEGCSWTIDADHLALPVLRSLAEVRPWLAASLRDIVSPPVEPTLEERVRLLLLRAEPVAALDLMAVAGRLRMSRATLARRLQGAGTSFQAIKDALRCDVGQATLARADGTVEAASVATGFGDARAFRRAFRGWTGMAPGTWRRNARRLPSNVGQATLEDPSGTSEEAPVLIKMEVLDRIVAGEITHLYRRWKRPAAKAGGRQRTPRGELAIDAVDALEPDALTDADAARGGFADLAALRESLRSRDGTIYRIAVRHDGPDPRLALREDTSPESVAKVVAALERKDRRGESWTKDTLAAIAAQPGCRAADLAESFGMDKPVFKRRVRQLKELGLTISLEKGYRLSPRGEAVLAALGDAANPHPHL